MESFFKISNSFSNYWPKTGKYSNCVNIDQIAMCYISMDSSRQALQPSVKLFSNFESFLELVTKFQNNSGFEFIQARRGRHLCWSARVPVFSLNSAHPHVSPAHRTRWVPHACGRVGAARGSCLKTGQHSIFVIIYLLLPINFIIFVSVSKILFNFFIANNNYDSNNENMAP